MSDHKGATLLPVLEYADQTRDRTVYPLVRKLRDSPSPTAMARYRQRHRMENMFGRVRDWHRIATRYDCCGHTFFSAIYIAAAVTFWL